MFYLYDQAGQLTMEINNSTGNGWQYTYDAGGNILTKRKVTQGVPESTNASTYTYGNAEWKDLLTAYNGNEITYDAAGNPLSYYNGFNFEWTMGRQLASVQRPGISAVSYTYNSDGLRTSKTIGNNTVRYTWIGDKVTSEVGNGNALYFYYDSNNTPVAVMLNGTLYYYVTNLQGDIIAMLDETGTAVVEYTYDAWGKTTTTGTLKNTVGRINPLRYRGYYYDSDVGLYYLQSRYYDSEIGRFINADEPTLLLAGVTNLFGYCDNNPVNKIDANGHIAANIIGAVIGGIVGAVGGYFLTNWLANRLGLKGWRKKLFVWGLSAVIGAAASVIGYFIGPYVSRLASRLITYTMQLIQKGKVALSKLSWSILKSTNIVNRIVNNLIRDASKLKYTKTALKHLGSRPYMRSTQTIINIMRSSKPVVDKSLRSGLKWVVKGWFNKTPGKWELVIDVATNTIVHFLFRK